VLGGFDGLFERPREPIELLDDERAPFSQHVPPSARAPEAFPTTTFSHPASRSFSSWNLGFWSRVDTLASPMRMD
jgi:hypothetical protein